MTDMTDMTKRSELGVLPVQRAVAKASPSRWQDLIVVACGEGLVEAVTLDGSSVTVQTVATPALGEPVALHAVAEILAVGATQYSARSTAF